MFRVIYENDTSLTLSKDDDTAYVQGNNDTVRGGLGDDWITTALRGDEPEDLLTTLHGGKGDDTLHAALTADGVPLAFPEDPGELAAVVDGGSGDDEIGIVLAALNSTLHATVLGGTGADTITVEARYSPAEDRSQFDAPDIAFEIDGGAGADFISVEMNQVPDGGEIIHGGEGNDTIIGGGGQAFGDAGEDTISVSSSEKFG